MHVRELRPQSGLNWLSGTKKSGPAGPLDEDRVSMTCPPPSRSRQEVSEADDNMIDETMHDIL